MSVFIRPDTKDATYSYRFQLDGRQFSGNTGKTNRREAEKVEEARREEAKALLAADAALFGSELTLEQAAARWWHEKGQHRSDAERCKWSLAWLIDHFGRSMMLQDITDSRIAAMVAKRRGEFDQRCTKNEEKRLVGPATVNRTVTEPLRQVILRARDVWEVRTANIKWRKHFLKEPQERVREASVAEEAAIISKLSRGYDTAIRFAFLTGCRKKEILGLEWTDVSFTGRCFTVVGQAHHPNKQGHPCALVGRAEESPEENLRVHLVDDEAWSMKSESATRSPTRSVPARCSGQSPALA